MTNFLKIDVGLLKTNISAKLLKRSNLQNQYFLIRYKKKKKKRKTENIIERLLLRYNAT